jgi:hypothetical protein
VAAVAASSAESDDQEAAAARREDALATSAALEDEPLVVPRRPYWLVALGVAVVLSAGAYVVVPRWIGKPAPLVASTVSEEIRKARELLSPSRIGNPGAVEEALGLLLVERQSRNSSELQRLLSMAYEAQSNRLRALGHLHMAVRLAGDTSERPVAQLALAQLLARMGHAAEACQAALRVLHERPPVNADLHKHASALASTLGCPGK